MSLESKLFRDLICVAVFLLLSVTSLVVSSEQSYPELLKLARDGDASAQYEVAEIYYQGEGVKRNYQEAFNWYEKAAKQNHAEAQHQMGYFYKHGLDVVEKDDKRAFEWYLEAAEGGHIPAQTQVAIMYSLGIGVKKNKELSRLWSDRMLEKKGLIDSPGQSQPATPKKVAPKPQSKPKPKPAAKVKPKQKPESQSKPVAEVKAAPRPQRSAEEQKAWRYEQARLLREKANKNSPDVGGWAEE